MGARHPPPIAATQARSASTRRLVSASSAWATLLSSPARTWSASAPWPASGSTTSGSKRWSISSASPSRSRPQAASTTASRPRSARFRSRVSMFPRRGSIRSSDSRASSCARRRIEAVPTRSPGRSSLLPQSASRASSRGRYAPTASPSVSVEVMSFAEWTATSTLRAKRASSSSLMNTPRLPISPKGLLRSRSPAVVTGTSANSSPGRRRRSTASSACLSASRLPLEPILRTTTVLGCCRFLQAHDRLVQELVHDLARQRFDRLPLALRESGKPAARLGELTSPDRLRPLAERGDRGHDVPRCQPLAKTLGLGGGDRLGLGELRLAAWGGLVNDRLEIVDVVQVTTRQLVDRWIEVSRDGEIDQQQRSALPRRERPGELVLRQHVAGRARGGDDDVRRLRRVDKAVELDRRAAELLSELPASRLRAVGDERERGTALRQPSRRPRPDLSGADDRDLCSGEISEHLRRECGRRGRGGARTLGDRRVRPDLLPGVEGVTEQPVEQRAHLSVLVGG